MYFCSKYKAVHDLVAELPDEVSKAEHLHVAVDAAHGLGEAVVVDTADEIGHKSVSDIDVDARENELIEVQHTGPGGCSYSRFIFKK